MDCDKYAFLFVSVYLGHNSLKTYFRDPNEKGFLVKNKYYSTEPGRRHGGENKYRAKKKVNRAHRLLLIIIIQYRIIKYIFIIYLYVKRKGNFNVCKNFTPACKKCFNFRNFTESNATQVDQTSNTHTYTRKVFGEVY